MAQTSATNSDRPARSDRQKPVEPLAAKTARGKSVAAPSRESLRLIRLFLCDVDGVLTDGRILIGAEGEIKRYHIRDGLGLRFLSQSGILVGWISNRPSHATTLRAVELKIDFLSQVTGSKVAEAERILSQTQLAWENVCYLGDDVVDLGVLRRAGLGVAVADAVDEAKAAAHYVTKAPGGAGAVREVVELILKAQNKWDRILERCSA